MPDANNAVATLSLADPAAVAPLPTAIGNGALPPNPQDGSPSPTPAPAPTPPNQQLLTEIAGFLADTQHRYMFNNRWDIVLSAFGILLSIALVAAGFTKEPIVSAVLGALMGAVVTAQKAFPFGQRAMFYRLLIGQVANLQTSASQGLISSADAVAKFCTLRMDFAQQLPRGSTTTPQEATPPEIHS